MAQWKKLLVSGSNISNLNNDSGYLLSAGGGIISSSAQIDHDTTTNFVAGEHFLQSAITTVGTVTAGSVTSILPSGTISGSGQVVGQSITNPAAIYDNGGTPTLRSGITAVEVKDLVDLGTADSPQFTNLTLSGNLTVEGSTINANVTNLDIEDRFILLNSGSSTIGDSGIVFGGTNGTAQNGAAFIWDASYNSNDGRAAIVNNMNSNATGDQTPSYHVAGVFEGTTANAATAQADHVGNIRVEGTDIFIYV